MQQLAAAAPAQSHTQGTASPELMGRSSARLGLLLPASGDPVAQAAAVQLPNAGPGPKGLRQEVRALSVCPASPGAQHSAALACGPALGSCRSRGRLSFTPPGTVLFRTLSVRDQEASRHHGSKWVPAAAFSCVPWQGVTWPLPPAPPDMSLSEAWC